MDAQSARIGFIGFGNMASAMAKGLIECAGIEGSRICACAAHFDSLEKRCEPLSVRAFKSPAEVVENCDLVVISVRSSPLFARPFARRRSSPSPPVFCSTSMRTCSARGRDIFPRFPTHRSPSARESSPAKNSIHSTLMNGKPSSGSSPPSRLSRCFPDICSPSRARLPAAALLSLPCSLRHSLTAA